MANHSTGIARALLFVFLLQGCSTYRLQVPGQIGVTDHRRVVWSYAWGLEPGQPDIDCQGQAIYEVTVESNLGFDLLTIVTLGLASPKTFAWACAPADPDEGSLFIPPEGGS